MKINSDGDASISLHLSPGTHLYHFIVDGKERFAPDQTTFICDKLNRVVNTVEVKDTKATTAIKTEKCRIRQST